MLDRLVAQLANLRVGNIPIGESLLLAIGNCVADIGLKTSYGLGNTVKIPTWLSGGVTSWGLPFLLRSTTLAGPNTQERLTTIMFARLLDDILRAEEVIKSRIEAVLKGLLGGKAVNVGAAEDEDFIYVEEETPEILGSTNEETIGIGYDEVVKKEKVENRIVDIITNLE